MSAFVASSVTVQLKEYIDVVSNGLHPDLLPTYLEIANEGPFEIQVWIPPSTQFYGDFIMAERTIDGHRLPVQRIRPGMETFRVAHWHRENLHYALRFSRLAQNDGQYDIEQPDRKLDGVGEIVVTPRSSSMVHRCYEMGSCLGSKPM